MNIKEMYENNEKMDELKELIENHTAVIDSGRSVSEDYYKQLENLKNELSGMNEIKEEEIDKKVSEYEKIVEEYEKNNEKANELKKLIENHTAIIDSGRNVPEDFYKQLEGFKKELAGINEVPKDRIMAYKRQLAIAYKHKLKNVDSKNKEYDRQEQIVDAEKSIIMSGRKVGNNYNEQYIENVNKLKNLKRISDDDINKWKKVIGEVDQDDKEIAKLEDLIRDYTERIMSGAKVGPNYENQLEDLKKELAERKKSMNLEDPSKETSLVPVKKPKMMQRIGNFFKKFKEKVISRFNKKEDKSKTKNEITVVKDKEDTEHKKFTKELGNDGNYTEPPLSKEELKEIQKGLESKVNNNSLETHEK